MIPIKETADGLTFSVYVQPRASKIALAGCHNNALKIKLTAPPVGGAANKQCIQILAKTIGLPKSAITITGGQSHRLKQIQISPMGTSFTSSQLNDLKKKIRGMTQKSS
jgi:uncharacterized protein (TIGR00251 family)